MKTHSVVPAVPVRGGLTAPSLALVESPIERRHPLMADSTYDAHKLKIMLLGFEDMARRVNPKVISMPVGVVVEETIICRITGVRLSYVTGLVIEVKATL